MGIRPGKRATGGGDCVARPRRDPRGGQRPCGQRRHGGHVGHGALLYIAGAEVQIGEIKNGWAWIKTGPGRLDGPGFVPLSVLEAA